MGGNETNCKLNHLCRYCPWCECRKQCKYVKLEIL